MSLWEYLIVALPDFGAATNSQGQSASVAMLNREGAGGWEAVAMTSLGGGHVAVLLKRPLQPVVADGRPHHDWPQGEPHEA